MALIIDERVCAGRAHQDVPLRGIDAPHGWLRSLAIALKAAFKRG